MTHTPGSPSALAPLWALLPIKDFARAKSRLAPILSNAERAALARKCCAHVLSVLSRCEHIAGVLILSDSEEVLRFSQQYGIAAERELSPLLPERRPGERLGAIVDDGLCRLERRGAKAALVLMSDLPLIDGEDLGRVVSLLRENDCVIAPDLREQNTNALALRTSCLKATAFGTGNSFARHLELAAHAGLRVAVHRTFGIGFDVDIPSDYAELRNRQPAAGENGSADRG